MIMLNLNLYNRGNLLEGVTGSCNPSKLPKRIVTNYKLY